MKKPPPLPEAVLTRVLGLAKFNGRSVVIIASLGALLSVAFGDWIGTAVGLVVAYGGGVELAGRRRLLRSDPAGVSQLVRAQWIVLGAILVYCARQVASFDLETAMGSVTPALRSQLAEAGFDLAPIMPLVRLAFYATYVTIAIVTLVYQGGMARYYGRRAPAIGQAISDRMKPPPPRPSAAGPEPEDLLT